MDYGVTSSLYDVDTATGGIPGSVDLNTKLDFTAGLGFDPLTGVAYVADGSRGVSNDSSLYTLNTSTGALARVGAVAVVQGGVGGLPFTQTPQDPQAVPEPPSLALAGMAFAGWAGTALGCRRRTRR